MTKKEMEDDVVTRDQEEEADVFCGEDLSTIGEEMRDDALRGFHRGGDMQMRDSCRDDAEALLGRKMADATTIADAHICHCRCHTHQSWKSHKVFLRFVYLFVWYFLAVSP